MVPIIFTILIVIAWTAIGFSIMFSFDWKRHNETGRRFFIEDARSIQSKRNRWIRFYNRWPFYALCIDWFASLNLIVDMTSRWSRRGETGDCYRKGL